MSHLFHVSEQAGTTHFEPRWPPTANAATRAPVVWAVDEAHLPNYLVPRECPRVAFQSAPNTTPRDHDAFFAGGARHVVAIESTWFDRAISSAQWLYEFAPEQDGVALISAFCPGARRAWLAFGRVRRNADLRVQVLSDQANAGAVRLCRTLNFSFHGEWRLPGTSKYDDSLLPQPSIPRP